MFKLAEDGRRSKDQTDDSGTVLISIMLCYTGHRPVKGNIIRKIRIANANVSEVYEAIKEKIID